VVGYYRKLIDELVKENSLFGKTSSGKVIFDFEPNLEKSFNRGFTDYFLENRKDCFSFLSPKSIGERIGTITKTGKDFFEISSSLNIHPQDGLCFLINDELSGCLVNKVERNKIFPNRMDGIKVGVEIYRNFDSEFEKNLKNSKTNRKIFANIEFNLNKIKAEDEDGNKVEIVYEFEEFAQNEEKMRENIQTQFKKSGESDFLVENFEIKTDKNPFLPISKINEIRRELLKKLMEERLKNYKQSVQKSSIDKNANYPQSEVDFHANILNKYAKNFYEKHGCKVVEMALESSLKKEGRKAMTTKHCLKYAFNLCKSTKELFLIDEKGKKYPLKFNCEKCEMEIYFGEDH